VERCGSAGIYKPAIFSLAGPAEPAFDGGARPELLGPEQAQPVAVNPPPAVSAEQPAIKKLSRRLRSGLQQTENLPSC